MTLRIAFSEAEKETINRERYHHPHAHVRKKMEALWLKSQGLSHQEICRLASISETTLWRYLNEYQRGGLAQIQQLNFHRPESELVAHQAQIEAHFRDHPPATIKQAMAEIETLTGLKRSEPQVRTFLKSIGMRCRKVGMIPAKADPQKQADFITQELDPLLAEAKTGQRKVFFVDAAHFVLAPFLGMLWSFTRLFIQAPSGRQRFNVLAALDAIDHALITVTNDSYINALSLCDLLRQTRALHPSIPITYILDNARYQKCKIVWELAQELEIDLCYLPPYSPNLNIIERLWKFVKKECLYSTYYADFDRFKLAISTCLSHTHDTHKVALDSLLTLNFQTFDPIENLSSLTS